MHRYELFSMLAGVPAEMAAELKAAFGEAAQSLYFSSSVSSPYFSMVSLFCTVSGHIGTTKAYNDLIFEDPREDAHRLDQGALQTLDRISIQWIIFDLRNS